MHAMHSVSIPRCVGCSLGRDQISGDGRTGRIQLGMRPVLLDANRLGLELFVAGFGTFVEAFDDAAELHGRYVRGFRTWCASEGEWVL